MKRQKISGIYADAAAFSNQSMTVCGWVRTVRDMKNFGFIELNDGSCFKSLQVVFERESLENYEEIDASDEEKLLSALEIASKEADVIAVSDYCTYGVITKRVKDRLCELGKKIPVIVDSRDRIGEFKNVIIKPNEVEAARATGTEASTLDEYKEIGKRLQKETQAPVIVTLGGLGGLWCENGECEYVETAPANGEIDIVGAGDTFISAFSCAYAVCKDGKKAMAFANLASGVTVKKIGTTGSATPEEIIAKWEELCRD